MFSRESRSFEHDWAGSAELIYLEAHPDDPDLRGVLKPDVFLGLLDES